MTPAEQRQEALKLADVLRTYKHQAHTPYEVAEHLLANGYSRTAVAFDQGFDQARDFDAAVQDALGLVE